MDNPITSSQSQQTVNPTPPVAHSGKSKVIPIIFGIAAVVAIAIGAYALGAKQSQTPVQNIVQTTPIPSPTPDPTANWKTYINTKYGYSVKHPSAWKVIEAKPRAGNKTEWTGDILIDEEIHKVSFLYQEDLSSVGWFQIKILPNPNKLTLNQWLIANKPLGSKRIPNSLLGGQPAERFVVPGVDYPNSIDVITVLQDKAYYITMEGANVSSEVDNPPSLLHSKKTYESILSTFQFIP